MRLLLLVILLVGCSDDSPPPPSPNQKVACDTLNFCQISSKGFSCDGDRLSVCAQCINANNCSALLGGVCARDCPGVELKPK